MIMWLANDTEGAKVLNKARPPGNQCPPFFEGVHLEHFRGL